MTNFMECCADLARRFAKLYESPAGLVRIGTAISCCNPLGFDGPEVQLNPERFFAEFQKELCVAVDKGDDYTRYYIVVDGVLWLTLAKDGEEQ